MNYRNVVELPLTDFRAKCFISSLWKDDLKLFKRSIPPVWEDPARKNLKLNFRKGKLTHFLRAHTTYKFPIELRPILRFLSP